MKQMDCAEDKYMAKLAARTSWYGRHPEEQAAMIAKRREWRLTYHTGNAEYHAYRNQNRARRMADPTYRDRVRTYYRDRSLMEQLEQEAEWAKLSEDDPY